jgi:formate hydrogenlyase transcriptional activator
MLSVFADCITLWEWFTEPTWRTIAANGKDRQMSTPFATAVISRSQASQVSFGTNVLPIRTRRKIGSHAVACESDPIQPLSFEQPTGYGEPAEVEATLVQLRAFPKDEIHSHTAFDAIVGNSLALRNVLNMAEKVAAWDSTVLLLGETGTGKELIAQAIHRRSRRSHRPLIKVNCAALPSELVASELFGHEKGSFTGAFQQRIGRFEAANGGTIFLDEIAELSADMQVALLRVLQEKEFERVGGNRTIKTDVRVIAATNKDLWHEVSAGRFRMDLFYRLNVFPIRVPALRERLEDIPLLVDYFIRRLAAQTGRTIRQVEEHALSAMRRYSWPGNIRELQNLLERCVILGAGEVLRIDPSMLTSEPPVPISAPAATEARSDRKAQIETVLRETRGKVHGPNGAAARLHIAGTTLDSQILALGIKKYQFK